MQKSKETIIADIQKFLEGWGDEERIVNLETYYFKAKADCYIQNKDGKIEMKVIPYTNFLFTKDFKLYSKYIQTPTGKFYNGDRYEFEKAKQKYGIELVKLDTSNHPRLNKGYVYLIKSTTSFNALRDFLKEGGFDTKPMINAINEKIEHAQRELKLNDKQFKDNHIEKDDYNFNKKDITKQISKLEEVKKDIEDFIYKTSLQEQFFISTGNRLFKGLDQYSEISKLIFDIETTGLNPRNTQITHIGMKWNGANAVKRDHVILEVNAENQDEEEARIIRKFVYIMSKLNPSIIGGYNSELFDFNFILTRCEILKERGVRINVDVKTGFGGSKDYTFTFDDDTTYKITRKPNAKVKIGGATESYTSTNIWGTSVVDILHAVKRAAATNTEIKKVGLKEICKYAKIAKPDRMYVQGDRISKIWKDNNLHIVSVATNKYEVVPDEFIPLATKLYQAQTIGEDKKVTIDIAVQKEVVQDINFKDFLIEKGKKYGKVKFMTGKEIVGQYLYDDLWETEQVDMVYSQSAFLLAKIVPANFHRIYTMGTAAVWNLLMTTWSYEKSIAIPIPDIKEKFSGGLARCFRKGYSQDIIKVDFASLYPMLELTYDIFPSVDVTGVIKDILIFLTTERNKFKKLKKEAEEAGDTALAAFYDAKQMPLKILNNSLFGALGANIAFNWGDNVCAARITCSGRLHLRKLVKWANDRFVTPLLAVTDGVNFSYPRMVSIDMDGKPLPMRMPIDEAWVYGKVTGISALVEKYNQEELPKPYMKVDDDGRWQSSYNLSRINYANLTDAKKDKKTGEMIPPKIKLTGNTIKSKVMPEYIEEFISKGLMMILEGKGAEFVEYYYKYVEEIYYHQIPLKKIATKKKYKSTIYDYINRGTDRNGRKKSKMAYMELMMDSRYRLVVEEYIKQGKTNPVLDQVLDLSSKLKNTRVSVNSMLYMKNEQEIAIELVGLLLMNDTYEKDKKEDRQAVLKGLGQESNQYVEAGKILLSVKQMLRPEPELGSMVFFVNSGTKKGHRDSDMWKDPVTGEEKMASMLIDSEQMELNPDMKGEYNKDKYLAAFNSKMKSLIEAFDPKVRKKMIVKKPEDRQYFTEKEVILSSHEADNLEEAMFLEYPEIDFWNRTGLDPRKIYDGFKVPQDYPLFSIYDQKFELYKPIFELTHAGQVLKKINDDNILPGDFVLFKNFNVYDLYRHNGVKLIPHTLELDIPFTEEEKKYEEFIKDRKRPINEDKPHDFLINKMMGEKQLKEMVKLSKKFKKLLDIPKDKFLSEIDGAVDEFYNWLEELGIDNGLFEDDVEEEEEELLEESDED